MHLSLPNINYLRVKMKKNLMKKVSTACRCYGIFFHVIIVNGNIFSLIQRLSFSLIFNRLIKNGKNLTIYCMRNSLQQCLFIRIHLMGNERSVIIAICIKEIVTKLFIHLFPIPKLFHSH